MDPLISQLVAGVRYLFVASAIDEGMIGSDDFQKNPKEWDIYTFDECRYHCTLDNVDIM